MPAYKNERGTWNAQFYYTDWMGKRRQKKKEGFATKGEALRFDDEFLVNMAGTPDIIFRNMCTLYLDDCHARLKPTTVSTKENLINKHLIPYFGDMPMNEISIKTVRAWQNHLLNSEEHYAATYMRACHVQLSSIFNFAFKFYKLSQNPAKVCGCIGCNKRDNFLFWTPEEFQQFITAFPDKPMAVAAFNLLFYSGIREGELPALTLNDLDFGNNTLIINKSYARLKGVDIIQKPKTVRSRRTITMPPEILDIVKQYAESIDGYTPDKRLFPVTKKYLHYMMEVGAKKSGVKKIRIHDIRHSHASMLIEMGFAPLLISERLGHEDVTTTLSIYSHLYPNKHSEVADRISEMLKS